MGIFCSNMSGGNNKTSCIYVCQSGTCRSKGSDAALLEIEELAELVENDCRVERSGCLGYCRQAPAVEVVNLRSNKRRYHVKVNTLRKSAAVVEDATGEAPPIENLPPGTESRLADIRATKRREFFVATYAGFAGRPAGSFRPSSPTKSVLLLLAGTGIVALPQILAHREPHRLLGIPVPKYKQIQCPVDLIHSCREDDILLLPEIKLEFRGLRSYTLLLTKEKRREDEAVSPPFAKAFNEDDAASHGAVLKDVPNAQARYSRLDKRLVEDAVRRLDRPFRVVVSGPDSFNSAAREFLDDCGVESKHVTTLSA